MLHAMNWKETFIHEFAGAPARVALSILNTTLGGVLAGHFLFGVALSGQLLAGALIPPLFMVVTASLLKRELGDTG
jgi:hypothetical protein